MTERHLFQHDIIRKSKLDQNILKRLATDFQWIFNQMQPDKNLTPNITAIDYSGLAGMSLQSIARPVKILLNISRHHQSAFKLILTYVEQKFPNLRRLCYDTYLEMVSRSADFHSESHAGSAVNNSSDS